MSFEVEDWGKLAYGEALARQREVLEAVAEGARPDTLVLVEHDPVLTLGANFHEDNLLLRPAEYAARGIELHRIGRGGDVTYHGPGQLVVYPIFDVALRSKDLHRWLRDLEQAMLVVAATFGLEGRRFPPHTGVWIGERKLAAIGIQVKRWVSMHGIALNCETDLARFDLIVPCGIQGYGVTSLSLECGRRVSVEDAKPVVVAAFHELARSKADSASRVPS